MKHLATVVAALLATNSALACSSLKQPSGEELFSKANSVFRARVTEVRLSSLPNPDRPSEKVEVVEARYEVKEVFKGRPPASGVVRDLPFAPGNCSLGVLPGIEYTFFPGQHDLVLVYSGSFAYFNAEDAEVKPKLEELRRLSRGQQ
jgi:hypothetical protein